jgi:hypothetical protein
MVVYGFLLLLVLTTWTATTTATMMRMMRMMKKHIHRFFLAARAESTAFSVCWRLKHDSMRIPIPLNSHVATYPTSKSLSADSAAV